MKKHILALVMVMVMLMGALCGCENVDLEPGDLYIGLEMGFVPSDKDKTRGVIHEAKTVGLSDRFYDDIKAAALETPVEDNDSIDWFQYAVTNTFENSGRSYIGETYNTSIDVSDAGVKVGDMEVKYTKEAIDVKLEWSDNETAFEVVNNFNALGKDSGVQVDPNTVWSNVNMDFTLVFPNEDIELEASGIKATAVGNVVVIDAYGFEPQGKVTVKCKLPVESKPQEEEKEETPAKPVVTGGGFSDVGPNDWFYKAVLALQGSGIVNGTGANEYHSYFVPNGTLTWEQMCQILAKASNLDTGYLNGYWAGKAIDSVILNGFINPLSDSLDPEVYSEIITREHAIAAVARAAEKVLPSVEMDESISESDIPDWDEIDKSEQADVLKAYQMGLTTGVDENRRFDPKGQMTRAQACQLLYNMGWTTPTGKLGSYYGPDGKVEGIDSNGRRVYTNTKNQTHELLEQEGALNEHA